MEPWRIRNGDLEQRILGRDHGPALAAAVQERFRRAGPPDAGLTLREALAVLEEIEPLSAGLGVQVCFVRAELILASSRATLERGAPRRSHRGQ